MCCIFTCCGWVLDLIQRVWTFAMSCCIFSAVCCTIIIACMSGIALGYNYSLAEYIDLKETNVSVYLKRGVFDDEIADDMEWRRSGPHQSVAGALGDNGGDMITPGSANDMPLRSGRRMDDSIFESDDRHRFEGSLIKLTQKPVYETTTPTTAIPETFMQDISKFPVGSLNQLKEVQAMINRRKMEYGRTTTNKYDAPGSTLYLEKDPNALAYFPQLAPMGLDGRRMMITEEPLVPLTPSVRDAVPVNLDRWKWANPRYPPEWRPTGLGTEKITWPPPFVWRKEPLRATEPSIVQTTKSYPPPPPTTPSTTTIRFPVDELPESQDQPSEEPIDSYTRKPGGIIEEYDEDIKGLPVRRRRNVIETSTFLSKLISNTLQYGETIDSSTVKTRSNENSITGYQITENI